MKIAPRRAGFLIAAIAALIPSLLIAGVSGKVSGKVTDQKTGEVLPGANVVLPGTGLGASTDVNGEYFILRVPPGAYTLNVTLLGYRAVTVKNVQVSIDQTTRISVELSQESVTLKDEIVITAERPPVQRDATSSTQYVDAKQIAALPVADAREGLLLQTGVFLDPIPAIGGLGGAGRGEQRYAVRGGTQEEVKWFVDGVRTAALVEGRADRGGSFTNVNQNAVQEIQLLTGGFSAEYGEAQSGIVNVVTKEGGSRFSGSVEYIYGVPGQHHFGNYLYDPSTQKEFLDHRLPDGSLDPKWWTPYRQKQTYDYTKIPDHTVYLSLGGPLYTGEEGKGTFFLSSGIRREAYDLPHPRDTRNTENALGNFAFILRPDMRLRITGLYNHEAHSTLQENGDYASQAKYDRGWGSLLDTYTWSASAQLTHTLSSSLYYDLKLSTYQFDSFEGPSAFTELGQSKNPDLFGFQKYDGYQNEPFDAWSFIQKNHSTTGDISLVGSVSFQADRANLLKAGFEARTITMAEHEADRFPSFSTDPRLWLNRGLQETYHPIQGSIYVQDKMEFESMVLNIGLRYDYFNPNRTWFWGNNLYNLAIDPAYDATKDPDKDQVDSLGHVKYSFDNVLKQPRSPSPSYHMFSPRLGVSFPISENTVLRFNYGHFYQMPPLDWMFEFSYFRPIALVQQIAANLNNPSAPHVASNDGDPERVVVATQEPLKPMKTVSFEAGIKHDFEGIAVVDVVGFYKDVTDQTYPAIGIFDRRIYGYNPFTGGTTANTFYSSLFPGDYGDSRGFEISIRSLFSQVWTVDINYSFSRSMTARASPGRININKDGNLSFVYDTDVNKRVPVETNFSRPHIVRANLYVQYPSDAGEGLLTTLLRGGSVSLLYRFVSGQAFTYLGPSDPPDTYDNYRYPASNTVDVRLDKTLSYGETHQVTITVRITNLLNTKNVRSIGDIFFDANAVKKYVETGQVSTKDGGGYDISALTYFEPRRVYLSFKYSF
jgi:outer membrane receptor for ferrienterochelin and colicin